MVQISVQVKLAEMQKIPPMVQKFLRVLLRNAAQFAEATYKQEVPKKGGDLAKGVRGQVRGDDEARVEITAGLAIGGVTGTLHLKSGKTKYVPIRASPNFNYARAVDDGIKPVSPKRAKALLIQVSKIPVGESYIIARGKIFIVRPSTQGFKGRNYSAKANAKIETSIPFLVDLSVQQL